MDELEQELRQAFARQPAPFGMKNRIMQRRNALHPRSHAILWQRLAAVLVLTAVLGGGVAWHQREQQHKGEAACRQVMTALRITNHALDHMNRQLAAHHRASQE
jgi:hypothetical protein